MPILGRSVKQFDVFEVAILFYHILSYPKIPILFYSI